MEYKVEEFLSYKLHMIKTNKFKTITVKVIFSDNIKKEFITIRNFLSDILVYSSKKYPTQKDFSVQLQDLYASNIMSNSYRVGKIYNTEIIMSFLNDKYTEKGMFDKNIEFLADTIFNPNVDNNSFDNDSFNVIKETTKAQIESIKEDTRKLSLIKMLETMDSSNEYSFHGFGYMEDLEKINPSNLYDYYLQLIKNSKIDIFVSGDIDFIETKNIISKFFKFNTIKKTKNDIIIKHDNYRKRPIKTICNMSLSQAKLSIGCKIDELKPFERNYVLTLYSIILGGGCDSKFFKNIREKKSLCYYISSIANKLDNLLLIVSGITKDNFDKVIKLIKEEMKNMEKGIITENELKMAKINYITMLDEIEDSQSKIIAAYYSMELFDLDNIETRKKEVEKVTINDIKLLSKKIHMDTIFLLGGGN